MLLNFIKRATELALVATAVASSQRAAWNGSYSRDIKILNGVRQGGVLSPVFFLFQFICSPKMQQYN